VLKNYESSMSDLKSEWIYGLHAVLASLSNPARIPEELLLTVETKRKMEKKIQKILNLRYAPHLPTIKTIERKKFDKIFPPGAVHQGIALRTKKSKEINFSDFIKNMSDSDKEKITIVALDHVLDPRNAGAIIRTCAAFGVDAIIQTKDHAPKNSPELIKAAAGGVEFLNIFRVVNLANTLRQLKKLNFWCIGMSANKGKKISSLDTPNRLVLIAGSEEKGLRNLTEKNCDILVNIPLKQNVGSLNVSVATGIVLHKIKGKDFGNS